MEFKYKVYGMDYIFLVTREVGYEGYIYFILNCHSPLHDYIIRQAISFGSYRNIYLSINKAVSKTFLIDNQKIATKEKTNSKEIAHNIYKKAHNISLQLAYEIEQIINKDFTFSSEEKYLISKINFRVYGYSIKKNKYLKNNPYSISNTIYNILKKFKDRVTEKEFKYILNDLQKLNTSLIKYIFNEIQNKEKDYTFYQYIKTIKNAPKIVKNCKYGFTFSSDRLSLFKKFGIIPKNKFEYFVLFSVYQGGTWLSCGSEKYNNYIKSFVKCKKTDYDYYVEHRFISDEDKKKNRRYSLGKIIAMRLFIEDGDRIYDTYKQNKYGISLKEINSSLSIKKQVKLSLFNHRQEGNIRDLEIQERAKEYEKKLMPAPKVILPKWIEDIRIKKAKDMLLAGKDCNHCIGSYVNSDDIFVREDTVCAQINKDSLEIIQCYDKNDTVTSKSEDLKRRLEKDLKNINYINV